MSIRMSSNNREVIGAISTITGRQEYLFSTNHALNVNASITTGGTLSFVSIAQGGAGTTKIVSGALGQSIKVVAYTFIMSGNGTFKFQSNSTDLSGAMLVIQSSGVSANNSSVPILSTASGEDLNITTTGAAANGHLTYFLE